MISVTLLSYLVPATFTLLAIALMVYEKSKARRKVEIWISATIFRDQSDQVNVSAERLHSVVLNYFFLFCVAVVGMFVIAFLVG